MEPESKDGSYFVGCMHLLDEKRTTYTSTPTWSYDIALEDARRLPKDVVIDPGIVSHLTVEKRYSV